MFKPEMIVSRLEISISTTDQDCLSVGLDRYGGKQDRYDDGKDRYNRADL